MEHRRGGQRSTGKLRQETGRNTFLAHRIKNAEGRRAAETMSRSLKKQPRSTRKGKNKHNVVDVEDLNVGPLYADWGAGDKPFKISRLVHKMEITTKHNSQG